MRERATVLKTAGKIAVLQRTRYSVLPIPLSVTYGIRLP